MSLCCVVALSALITATSQAETNHKQSQTQTLSKEQIECLSKPNTKGYMSMSNKETIAKNKLKYENTIFKIMGIKKEAIPDLCLTNLNSPYI